MAQVPLKEALIQPPEPEHREGASPEKMIHFVFLTFSSAMAVSFWHKGSAAVCFLVCYFLDLAMLLRCLRLYARTSPGSPRLESLKMAVWLLATMLTITIYQLLELWFLMTVGKTENPIADFQKPRRMA